MSKKQKSLKIKKIIKQIKHLKIKRNIFFWDKKFKN
jgi:hypothetical protein